MKQSKTLLRSGNVVPRNTNYTRCFSALSGIAKLVPCNWRDPLLIFIATINSNSCTEDFIRLSTKFKPTY